ncbi:MAG: type II toxin-antitoxin system Phd/YefM family antitoxin [Stagnimonas sp.]|nr:type II toxin-antitoxin system Phd/YefM family antitoxin [Stagnimonas sp.]
MGITTLSSREFNQDASGAKQAARRGPVFITNRGRPEHVLLSIEQYQKITGGQANIVELLAMPRAGKVKFDPPRLVGKLYRPADLG